MDQLRKGTPQADQKARMIFEQALAIDPHYSRAYAGLPLSFFNEWSCQLWEYWKDTERHAYKYAKRAIELDESTELDDGNPHELGALYAELSSVVPNLNIFGGCCGTDHRHVEAICAAVMSSN